MFKNSPIFLLFHHDLGEILAARQPAGHHYMNPVGWCSDIVNLSLWLVEIIKTKQSLECKSTLKKCDFDVRKKKKCK